VHGGDEALGNGKAEAGASVLPTDRHIALHEVLVFHTQVGLVSRTTEGGRYGTERDDEEEEGEGEVVTYLEELGLGGVGDAHSRVGHFHPQSAVVLQRRGDGHPDFAAGGGELDGVGQQVAQHLFDGEREKEPTNT
jgi:hypothetical protein